MTIFLPEGSLVDPKSKEPLKCSMEGLLTCLVARYGTPPHQKESRGSTKDSKDTSHQTHDLTKSTMQIATAGSKVKVSSLIYQHQNEIARLKCLALPPGCRGMAGN